MTEPATAAPTTTEGATMDRNNPPADADRIFCPECERAVFYQRVHVSTHEAECPSEPSP